MKRAFVLLTMLMLAGVVSGQNTMTVDQYVWSLEWIHTLLEGGHIDGAKVAAAQLKGAAVDWNGGTVRVDDSLLDAIARADRADRELATRVETTIRELRRTKAEPVPADPKLLQQVAAEQHVPELAPGGEIPTTIDADAPLLERVAKSIGEMVTWLGEKIARFFGWLLDLIPSRPSSRGGATSGMRWIVIMVAALIVVALAILGIEAARRARRRTADVVASEPIAATRDEDPLSRGATEWEQYAAQLASSGRYREAIRAWYHAVLVTCYAAGVLHFRRGRTNWEYVAMLAPSLAWRPELIRLTRRFEREWYGADESTAEALDECGDRARGILDVVRRRGAA